MVRRVLFSSFPARGTDKPGRLHSGPDPEERQVERVGLDREVSRVHLGLPWNSRGGSDELMRLEIGRTQNSGRLPFEEASGRLART